MVQRTEFPELEALRDDLDRQRYEAQRAINDALYHGKTDVASEQQHARVSKTLEEIRYVLNFFDTVRFKQAQSWQAWQTVALITVTALALLLSIFSVWRG